MGVSVSTLREEFKKHIKPFVSDISKYGTHSMKSGAASNPACRKIADDLLDIHAGWRCESTKHIVGFHMTSLKFKLKNYRSYRDFTFTMH